MKKLFVQTVLTSLFLCTIIVSCKKDSINPAPTITFITEAGYTSTAATVFEGDSVLIGLQCLWNGTDALKTLSISTNDVLIGSPVIISEAHSQSFIYYVKIKKSSTPIENWVFTITDAQGEKSSINITLTSNTGVRPTPTISFITGLTYTSSDKSVLESTDVLVGIHSIWNEIDAIETITVYKNDVMVDVPIEIPVGSYNEYSMDYHITKTADPTETWKFEVTDAFGAKSSVSLTLTREIPPSVFTCTIGAQDNLAELSYYSLTSKLNYNSTDALTNQTIIDFIGAYDATNLLHLISPNATASTLPEPYKSVLPTWTTRNNTQFIVSTLSVGQFDAITTEAPIISAYTGAASKKAKDLQVDKVVSFLTAGGKYGIFKVTAATASLSGKVTIQIKMQQ